MNDALKMFLIALVTTIASQLLLGPYILKLQGVMPITPTTVAPMVEQSVPAPSGGGVEGAKLAAPNLEGILVDEARDRWRAKGIEIIEEDERDGSGAEPGTILQQRPAPGAELSTREIRVVVARKSEASKVPDVTGKAVDDARKQLEEAGFEVPAPSPEASEKPANTVLRQTPAAGEGAKKGSVVRLVIAEPAGIEVPKFTGLYLGKAKKAITDAGLVIGPIRRVEHAELGQDYVLKQTPVAGEKVPPGTEVELVVVAPN
ncbi:MAG: PASTA domain-containing protein [Deltaproteobacteria bacterium]|nr:PASTA domain-containing protein [Deltaproteobacteria bacterium]MBK8719102.1 PASTA domain-containing protein [Deltaproteobacteria bacterium]MBP7288018.1 PASTA domain-containing protein [Nannocystaceae bacterium]